MKLQIISDLHFEFDRDHGIGFIDSMPVVADVLVIAGDMIPLAKYPDEAAFALDRFCDSFNRVIYVPGNHEYYGSSPRKTHAVIQNIARKRSRLTIPRTGAGEVFYINNIRFGIGTMWYPTTDANVDDMSDSWMIEGFRDWVGGAHENDMDRIGKAAKYGGVIITHHLPHRRSIDARFADSPLNPFFLSSDAEPLVEKGNVKIWIHGHTHTSCDYEINTTRVACNPRGYPGERRGRYDAGFCVEL